MPNGFFRSQKGVEEYHKIGLEYPNTVTDNNYLQFTKNNATSPHSARNRKELRALVRELANDGKEYILYDMYEVMYSQIGGEHEFYCPGRGKYPIPIAKQQIVFGNNMSTSEVVTGGVIRIDVGYEMPWSKENAEELHKFANDLSQQAPTQYIVRKVGGTKKSVKKWEDFRDGEFEDLFENGKITTTSQEGEKQKQLRTK